MTYADLICSCNRSECNLSTSQCNQSADLNDLLYGVSAIAAHLGTSERWAWNLFERGMIPGWMEGRVFCSSRSTIDRTIVEREAAVRAAIEAGHE